VSWTPKWGSVAPLILDPADTNFMCTFLPWICDWLNLLWVSSLNLLSCANWMETYQFVLLFLVRVFHQFVLTECREQMISKLELYLYSVVLGLYTSFLSIATWHGTRSLLGKPPKNLILSCHHVDSQPNRLQLVPMFVLLLPLVC